MRAFTVHLPDEKHQRLKALVQSRGTTVNRLIDEMATLMLAEFDVQTRFELRARRGTGQTARGLDLLKKCPQGVSGLCLHAKAVLSQAGVTCSRKPKAPRTFGTVAKPGLPSGGRAL